MSDTTKFVPKKPQVPYRQNNTSDPKPKKLLEQVHEALRTKHYSYRTEQTYIDWIKRYILFHQKQHPKDLGVEEIRAFIAHLATDRKVATSTQNQALSAILFLYRTVLQQPIDLSPNLINPSRPKRLPTVLTHEEAMSIIQAMRGTPRLMTKILYGSGLRLMECIRLRVRDIDFDHHQIIVRGGKGDDDRFTILPDSVVVDLKHILQDVKALHQKDLQDGYGETALPNALGVKYKNASKEWGWRYIFPASRLSLDPVAGIIRRHHLDETVLQKSIRKSPLIHSGIPLAPFFYKKDTTFAPSRSYLDIKMLRPP